MSQRLTLGSSTPTLELGGDRKQHECTFVVPIYERFADRPTGTPLPDTSQAAPDGQNERS